MNTHGRMTLEVRPSEPMAVEFVSSWHYAGSALIDEFDSVGGLAAWIDMYRERLGLVTGSPVRVGDQDRVRIVDLREAIRELLSASVDHTQPSPETVRLVDGLSQGVRVATLRWPPSGPQLDWPGDTSTADLLVTQVCASAVRVLTSPRRLLLRRCPAPRCVLFFSALRPGQAWCSPACGNRARVARHSARSST
jgi:predicted RNA-binding Zn ribbon-like protein